MVRVQPRAKCARLHSQRLGQFRSRRARRRKRFADRRPFVSLGFGREGAYERFGDRAGCRPRDDGRMRGNTMDKRLGCVER